MVEKTKQNPHVKIMHSDFITQVVTEITPILREAEEQCNVYAMCLLIDDQIFTTEFFIRNAEEYDVLFSHTPYEHVLQASPYYRKIKINEPFTNYLCEELPSGFGWFAWGAGDCELHMKHWRSLLTVTMPNGALSHFRFYGANIMADFIKGCTPTQIALLLGPITAIMIPLPDKTWLLVNNPNLTKYSAKKIAQNYVCRAAPWWNINEEQLNALENSINPTLVYNIRFDVWQNNPEWLEAFEDFSELDSFISSGIQAARDLGFSNAAQQTSFVKICLARNTVFLEGIPECSNVLYSNQLNNIGKLEKLAQILGVTQCLV